MDVLKPMNLLFFFIGLVMAGVIIFNADSISNTFMGTMAGILLAISSLLNMLEKK
jgi:membrane associated rhomboid family serine protease